MGGGSSKPKKKKKLMGFCTEEWDETYQCFFYHYSTSGESSWDRPEGMPESEEAKLLKAENAATASKAAAIRAAASKAAADAKVEELNKRKIDDSPNNAISNNAISSAVAEEASQWTVGWDDNYDAAFYYNIITGENVWEKPACLSSLHSQENVIVASDEEILKAARSDTSNWHVEWDASYRCEFYVNKITQESTWEVPPCFGSTDGDSDRVSSERVIPNKNRSRRNSVMRRPSVRPEKATLRRVSVLLTSPGSSARMTPGGIGGIGSTTASALSSHAETITSPSSAATPTPNPKRRQSLAPRPSGLPPKPLFVNRKSIVEEEDDEES